MSKLQRAGNKKTSASAGLQDAHPTIRHSSKARCTPPPMSPLARHEMRSSTGAAAAAASSAGIPFARTPGAALQR